MRFTQALLTFGLLGFGAGCTENLSECDYPSMEEPSACKPLEVSCGMEGRRSLQGSDPLELIVPKLIVAPEPVQVTVRYSDGSQRPLAKSTVEQDGKVKTTLEPGELGDVPGPVQFVVTRGRWSGETSTATATTMSCRLFRQPAFDSGRSKSYPRAAIPYGISRLDVASPVSVQIGASRGARSVLVTEELDPVMAGRWMERYTLSAGLLTANESSSDTLWKPLRDQYSAGTGDDTLIQSAFTTHGLLLYKNDLITISLGAGRKGWSALGVPIPMSAQLATAAGRDWFVLGTASAVTAFSFNGSTVQKIAELPTSMQLLAMADVEGQGGASEREFDVAAVSSTHAVSLLRLVGNALQPIESGGRRSLSESATQVLQSITSGSIPQGALAIADLDGDGLQDLVVWDGATQQIRWAAQFGSQDAAQFKDLEAVGLSMAGVQRLAVGYVDGDNKPDIAIVAANKVTVFLQR